ncbi:UDP-2,3-diacetamido-2,3-dideoxy-D-glucuronate 2-epimerase [uncultured Sphingopyxis sp.]|uniref:UDP-2,3-diacetamido-2,3-dideoxy-D-glucuronate 2-epimerase n=1 Tax=uncultured Sphingopyxis sp. TaxID=310581 RepID=A0A1Y5PS07_9SPHN|nr:UDP-N-acetylglucosamine 2-epimerase (non-hydrolyzing) [uncultured Sphingopyxis sp.]SBV32778.1 UDP-2,3-diacetamido-2,3-dideoxy-D-glucuronate 2-epimerase [uncultured Sphingopyxis sp.]
MTAKLTIATIVGARPQFIKASAVSTAIQARPDIDEIIIHTGQHYDANMSDVFFEELGIPRPAHNLDVHGGSHGAMTGRMLEGIERLLMDVRPDTVLVYGDTNSTLAGALAAAKLHIPVAHVEAGLRSFNMRMPEEINRILTDRVSDWLFAPTEEACAHLRGEGVAGDRIHNVGDVMFDVALLQGARVDAAGGALGRLKLAPKSYALATVHRAENTDDPQRLSNIVDALIELAKRVPVVWPVHPRTRGILARTDRWADAERAILIVDPVSYLEMVQLEKFAALIATDSGGVQKEAFFHGVPCVTLRDETEWTELVDAGWNRLAPPMSRSTMVEAFDAALGSQGEAIAPYGKGDAAQTIVQHLVNAGGK